MCQCLTVRACLCLPLRFRFYYVMPSSLGTQGRDGWCDSYLVILLHEPAGWTREVLQRGRADGMGWSVSVVCTCWKLHHLAPLTLARNYIICRAIPLRELLMLHACNKYMLRVNKCLLSVFDQAAPPPNPQLRM